MNRTQRVEQSVDRLVITTQRPLSREAIGQQRRNKRVLVERHIGGPVLGLQVPVHQKLREGEKPDRHLVVSDFPAILFRDDLLHRVEVRRWREVIHIADVRQSNATVDFQFLLQRQVGRDFVFVVPDTKARSGATTLQLHGHKYQRREALPVVPFHIDPLQKTHREKQQIHALLFLECSCVVIQLEQSLLQLFR